MASLGLFDMEQDCELDVADGPYISENMSEELEEFILDQADADAEDGLFNIVKNLTNK